MGEFAPTLVLGMLFMVLLGTIPRRYWFIQLPAVAGWVLVWGDSEFTGHWTDLVGATVTSFALLCLTATGHDDLPVPRDGSTR